MNDLMQNNKGLSKSKLAIIIACLAMLLFAFHTSTHMVGAGDTWVALACGRHFFNHGVSTVEPFSANSHRPGPTPEEIKTWPRWAQVITDKVGLDTVKFWHPTGWVNQNWLTHTIFYWIAYKSPIADSSNWCFNSLVYWKFVIYILSVICIYYTARVLGAHPALSAFFACAALFIGRSFIDIRPAGFSNLLVAAFILILVLASYRHYLYIWLIVPLVIFWANLHGGYIYVFIMLAPVVMLRLFILLPKRWTVSIYSILTWLALYVLIIKDTAHDPFIDAAVSPSHDKFLFLVFVFIIVSLVLAAWRQANAAAFYGYHVLVSLIVFFTLFVRLFPDSYLLQNPRLAEYVDQCQRSFFIAFCAAVGLGIIVTSFKDRLIITSPFAIRRLLGINSGFFNPAACGEQGRTTDSIPPNTPDGKSPAQSSSYSAARTTLDSASGIPAQTAGSAQTTGSGPARAASGIPAQSAGYGPARAASGILAQTAGYGPARAFSPTAAQAIALAHVVAAGFIAFICSILFNPFHLTNLTHTFQISISQNAEGWRNVHEWWPAFRWDNPVGSAMPFMIMLISGAGVIALYLSGRLLYPRFLKGNEREQEREGSGRYPNPKNIKGPKQEIDSQLKRFEILSKILGLAGMVLIMWVVLLSFSFVEANLTGFLLSGLFGGILWGAIFINVHCIYIIIPFSIFAVMTGEAGSGYSGRYIFPFITVPFYVLMFLVTAQLPKKPKYSLVNIFYVLAAAAVSLILMIVLVNPFNFKTPIWHLGQLMDLQRIWHPAYEANLEITYEGLFFVIYVINLLSVVAWVGYDIIRAILEDRGQRTEDRGQRTEDRGQRTDGIAAVTYQLPKIDLAMIMIAALTSYMAFRSRRFIPIAGYVTCPVIAMLIDQFIRTTGASWNFYRRGRLSAPDMPGVARKLLIAGAAATVIGLGSFWSFKFYRIYLTPWPFDPDLRSMFMRMTASHVKPFAACQFIDGNKMSGNMFNYWTEGGFIAWGQEPDPNTGKTPLQLFMDGRAQAAYNYDSYMTWSEIMFGGDVVRQAQMRNQSLTEADYVQIGKWLNGEMKQRNVWVILMPSGQLDSAFVKGIEYSMDWRTVYLDDKQRLYVDVTTPRGREIFEGIETGQTKYPYPATRNIMLGNNAVLFGGDQQRIAAGLECAIKAVEERPSRTSIQLLQIYYDRYPPMKSRVDEFWKGYLDDFLANEKRYVHSDNYHYRIMGALMAINHLMPVAQSQKNEELVGLYKDKAAALPKILNRTNDMRW